MQQWKRYRFDIALILLMVQSAWTAESQTPLGRGTSDWQGDLQSRLLESGKASLAERLCRTEIAKVAPGSDESAKWIVRLSRAMIEQAIENSGSEGDVLTSPKWAAAASALDDWLSGYENRPRAPWVRLARIMIDFRRSQLQSLRHFAAPEDASTRQEALTTVRRCVNALENLIADLDEMAPLAELRSTPNLAPGKDLRVLMNTAKRKLASALLSRSELYPAGSDDSISAALLSAERAERLMSSVAADDPTMPLVARLESEAWRRAGNTQKARIALSVLTGLVTQNAAESKGQIPQTDPTTLAMLVLIAVDTKEFRDAKTLLEYHYGAGSLLAADPLAEAAPHQLDLARLYFYTHSPQPNVKLANDWADAIKRRHGAYFGRLASLKVMRSLGGSSAEGDARLIAATAGALLRKGEFLAAGNRFGEAARAAQSSADLESAFKYWLQGGAAMQKAGDIDGAAEQLVIAARALPSHDLAASAHLQAAFLIAKAGWQDNPDRADTYEAILKEQLVRWPKGPLAAKARPLLSDRLEARQKWLAAAKLWTDETIDVSESEGNAGCQHVVRAGRLWRAALRECENEAKLKVQFTEAVKGLKRQPVVCGSQSQAEVFTLAVLFGELAILKIVAPPDDSRSQPLQYANQLAKLRLSPADATLATKPRSVEEPFEFDLLARMSADVRQYPELLESCQKAIASVASESCSQATTLERQITIVDALLHSHQWDLAIQTVDKFPQIKGEPIERHLATALLARQEPAGLKKAVEYLNRYARGVAKKSEAWSWANVNLCTALVKLGNAQEARKRARFVLLTNPPADEDHLAKIKAFAKAP